MKINIICVGKLKEQFLKEAIKEYSKRLNIFCNLKIIEVADESIPNNASQLDKKNILKKEGERILNKINLKDYIISLVILGHKYNSKQFAKKMQYLFTYVNSNITFIIGGSLGLSDNVIKKSNLLLSLSDLTFPHQLARVILIEQIYRSFMINFNRKYHK